MTRIKHFIGETIIYGFGGVFSRIFSFFLIPLYTSFLGKTDYTNLVMLQTVFTILSYFLALNAGVFYYYYEYNKTKFKQVILTSWFYYQIGFSVLLILLLFLFSYSLSNLFILNAENINSIKTGLLLVGLQLLPYSFNTTNINKYRIERKAKASTLVVLLEALFTFLTVFIVLKVFNLGLVEVLIAQFVSRLIVSLIYLKKSVVFLNIKLFSTKILKNIFSYSYPFIISSAFTWIIINLDKFIGSQQLINKEDNALLALGMQIVLPIVILGDMIRMAAGPFIMSIMNESNANRSYQQVFDLVIFVSCFVVIGIVFISPGLVYLFADESYINVIYLIPLIALSRVFSLAANQYSVGFNLAKRNTFIMYSIVIAGVFAGAINFLYMKKYGYLVSGISQLLSYIIMIIYLAFQSKRVVNFSYKLKNSILLIIITIVYLWFFYLLIPSIIERNYVALIIVSCLFLVCIFLIFLFQQKIKFSEKFSAFFKL